MMIAVMNIKTMKTYIIKIDNQYYCGEGEENKAQIPPLSNGFHQHTNHGESGIKKSYNLCDVKLIQSAMNLKSHLDKILRCVQPERMEIIATHWTEKGLLKEKGK